MIVCFVIHVPSFRKIVFHPSIKCSGLQSQLNSLFPHNLGQAFLAIPHTCNIIGYKQGNNTENSYAQVD